MAKYVMLFVGGTVPEDKQEQNMKDWMGWLENVSKTAKLADSGGPFGESKVISRDGVKDYSWENDSNVGGYIVVEAANIDEAMNMAKDCPALMPDYGDGAVEVREVMNM